MNFEFPDVADFPENTEPRFTDDILVRDFFQPQNPFKEDLKDLVDIVVEVMGLEKDEIGILNKQMKRVHAAAIEYYRSRQPWDLPEDACSKALDQFGIYSVKKGIGRLHDHFGPRISSLIGRAPSSGLTDYDRAEHCNDALSLSLVREYLEPMWNGLQRYRGGEKLGVRSVTLHVAKPGDQHHFQQFRDCEAAPKLINLHLDPKPGVMKSIIYLGNVGMEDGPFSYVKGSNNWKYDEIERIFAWGNSVGNYCHTPKHRRVANALPKRFRKNAIVGRLFPDGSEMANLFTKRLTKYVSEDANCMVFDPTFGFHRGGDPLSGMRINLQVVIK